MWPAVPTTRFLRDMGAKLTVGSFQLKEGEMALVVRAFPSSFPCHPEPRRRRRTRRFQALRFTIRVLRGPFAARRDDRALLHSLSIRFLQLRRQLRINPERFLEIAGVDHRLSAEVIVQDHVGLFALLHPL